MVTKKDFMDATGPEFVKMIQLLIGQFKLIDTGAYLAGMDYKIEGNSILITNNVPYALDLEYGTYAYKEKYGKAPSTKFSRTLEPKKKDITKKQASKLSKGMQGFAPVRRVIYNKETVNKLLANATTRLNGTYQQIQ